MNRPPRRAATLAGLAALLAMTSACGTDDSNAEGAAADSGTASARPSGPSESQASETQGGGSSQSPAPSQVPGGGDMPRGLTAAYGVVVGNADAEHKVAIYEDFQCPACQEFESVIKPEVKALVKSGQASFEYRAIAFLDEASTTKYSTRSLNAAYCVLDEAGTEGFVAMHDQLYAHQPPEGSAGLPDAKLISLAKQAGATGAASCITDQSYAGVAKDATRAAFDFGITGTPTMVQNGTSVDLSQATSLKDALGIQG